LSDRADLGIAKSGLRERPVLPAERSGLAKDAGWRALRSGDPQSLDDATGRFECRGKKMNSW
jgi:hypothetical protein